MNSAAFPSRIAAIPLSDTPALVMFIVAAWLVLIAVAFIWSTPDDHADKILAVVSVPIMLGWFWLLGMVTW